MPVATAVVEMVVEAALPGVQAAAAAVTQEQLAMVCRPMPVPSDVWVVPFFPRCKMGAWPEPFAEADPMFLLALLTQGSEKLRRTRIMNFGVHISRAGWFAAR